MLMVWVGLSTSGCCGDLVKKAGEKVAEKAIEEATGGDASVAIGDNVDLSKLPSVFRYPGATGKGQISQNAPTGLGTVYILQTTDPVEKVKAHYANISGFKQLVKMDSPNGTTYSYESADGKAGFHITIAVANGTTGITIVHSINKP